MGRHIRSSAGTDADGIPEVNGLLHDVELPPRAERRGLQPLRLGPRRAWSFAQWVAVSMLGLVVLVVLGSADGGASTADALGYLILVATIGFACDAARWLPGPVSRGALVVALALLAFGVLIAADALIALDLDFAYVGVACLVSCGGLFLSTALSWISTGGARMVRVAVIGSPRGMTTLARELEVAGMRGFEVVGWITDEVGDGATTAPVQGEERLGHLGELGTIVRRQHVDLLVMTGEASRLTVFNEVARSCLDLPVRFCELSSLHEDLFGHVPVTEINTAWFQYILHPRYSGTTPVAKRLMDVAIALLLAIPAAPFLLLLGLIVRRDGGPAFFKQTRIGEGGVPFVLYKLRTMSVAPQGAEAQWAGADDARITRIGALLRRTHVDELPQLLNVLRGDMSMVGPRPEQPQFVERLESLVPFYQRRHLIKPGLTGWAQVRCGYAGSDSGSLWKASHDLYYLKHRSLPLDVAILWQTAIELLSPRPHVVTEAMVSWVFESEREARAAVAEEAPSIPIGITAGDAPSRAAG